MDAFRYYCKEVDRLRQLGREWNLTEEDIEKIIDESFQFLEEHSCQPKEKRVRLKWPRVFLKAAFVVSCLILLMYTTFVYRKLAHNYIEQNIREIIYPGMKLIRKLMLPVIQIFPALTEWYDEACLVGNPYFQVSDIECWPCEAVRSILNLTASNWNYDQYHLGIPFIYRESNMKRVEFEDLARLYEGNSGMFDKEAGRIEDSRQGWTTPESAFVEKPLNINPSLSKDTHLSWKLNRLEATRTIRNLFGMILRTPSKAAGPTPEKYIIMDEENSPPYHLPATEGTNVFVAQGSGSRLILLNPSPECTTSCHRVSIVLTAHHILWFNWWYWRAVSVPLHQETGISVTYIGSYY